MENVKLTVKAIRTNMNMTQSDFAKLLNISLTSYCNKENGKEDFKWKEISKISDYSKIPIGMII